MSSKTLKEELYQIRSLQMKQDIKLRQASRMEEEVQTLQVHVTNLPMNLSVFSTVRHHKIYSYHDLQILTEVYNYQSCKKPKANQLQLELYKRHYLTTRELRTINSNARLEKEPLVKFTERFINKLKKFML